MTESIDQKPRVIFVGARGPYTQEATRQLTAEGYEVIQNEKDLGEPTSPESTVYGIRVADRFDIEAGSLISEAAKRGNRVAALNSRWPQDVMRQCFQAGADDCLSTLHDPREFVDWLQNPQEIARWRTKKRPN